MGAVVAAMVVCGVLVTACGGGSEESSERDESPGILVTATEGVPAATDPSAETAECGGSQADGTPEREQVLAIICATYPGVGFDPECSGEPA